jgi:hypothetical protein
MVFNGHTKESIDAIDEITMNEITVMYADGVIGNQGILTTLGSLVAGVFNYTRAPNTPAYNLKSILGNTYGYIFPEVKEDPSNSLLNFMTQAQGFSMDKFTKD